MVLLIYFMTTDDLSTILLREEEKEKNDFLPGEFLDDTQKENALERLLDFCYKLN